MNKYQEALNKITKTADKNETLQSDLECFYKLQELVNKETPTFEEVVKAWREVEPEIKYRDKAVDKNGIRILFPNGIIYEINTEQVYSNRKVFSMNVNQSLRAINLTVEYLKNRQINESDKATK